MKANTDILAENAKFTLKKKSIKGNVENIGPHSLLLRVLGWGELRSILRSVPRCTSAL